MGRRDDLHRTARILPTLLAGVVGLVLGWLIGGSVQAAPPAAPRSRAEPDPERMIREPAEAGRRLVQGEAPEPAGAEASPSASATQASAQRSESSLIPPGLRDYARAEMQRGWSEVRGDPMPEELLAELLADFEQRVRSMPSSLGRSAAERATEAEGTSSALRSGDATQILEKVPADHPGLRQLVRDPDRFADLFRPRSGGTTLDGPALRTSELSDGSVIVFPPGVYEVGDLARGRSTFPADVTLRGAGMNGTLLVAEELRPRGPLVRFTVEDCTLFTNGGITDVRVDPASITLRRVRVVGFDTGAGGSVALYLHSAALLASECRFESGYGRNPEGLANLVRADSTFAARFENCVFERVSLETGARTVLFRNCTMVDLLADPPNGPTYEGCKITVLPFDQRWSPAVRKRDLNDLFPQWRERLKR